MTLTEFHTLVSATIARGTSLDAQIPSAARRAARWLERNYTFKYMERYSEFVISSTANFPRIISLPSANLKSIRFVRIKLENGEFVYLDQIDPRDVSSNPNDIPLRYWLDGVSYLYLDATPTRDYNAEMGWNSYTAWPTDSGASNWLLDNGEDWLLYATLVEMSTFLRDPQLFQLYKTQRDEALRTLLLADEQLRELSQPARMQFEAGLVKGGGRRDG